MAMRIGLWGVQLLLAACSSAATSGQGTSLPPQAVQTCAERGYTPGTPAFRDCAAANRREASGTRGVVDTLFRAAVGPLR
jgi:hypothetical protein